MENSIEEDIKILEEMIENANIENMDMNDCFGGEHIEAIQHILSDYKRVLKENEKKDKIIDLMAEFIEDELTVDEFCTKEGCYADNYIDGHCGKCLNCIKQYFENKVKEV